MRASEIPSLTALRGIAALVIVTYHFEIFLAPGSHFESVFHFWHWGYLAVDFFFLLSGFVIAHVYGDALCDPVPGTAWRFIVARLARLYPLHLLTLAVMVAIVSVWTPTGVDMGFDWHTLPLSVVMQQQWLFKANWNYPSWSIGDEFIAYIGFIFAAPLVMRGRWAAPIAAACAALLVVMCVLKDGSLDTSHQIYSLARACAGFFLGAVLYRAWRSRPPLVLVWARIVILPCAVLAAWLSFDALLVPVFASLLILGAEARGGWYRALNGGPLLWLGEISFSMYLWHAPLHFALTGAFAGIGIDLRALEPGPSVAVLVGALALLFVIATLSLRFYETPARRFINGLRRPARLAAEASD